MIHLDFEELTEAFNHWASSQEEEREGKEPRHLAIDGKAIKASVKDYDKSYQNFAVTVSKRVRWKLWLICVIKRPAR